MSSEHNHSETEILSTLPTNYQLYTIRNDQIREGLVFTEILGHKDLFESGNPFRHGLEIFRDEVLVEEALLANAKSIDEPYYLKSRQRSENRSNICFYRQHERLKLSEWQTEAETPCLRVIVSQLVHGMFNIDFAVDILSAEFITDTGELETVRILPQNLTGGLITSQHYITLGISPLEKNNLENKAKGKKIFLSAEKSPVEVTRLGDVKILHTISQRCIVSTDGIDGDNFFVRIVDITGVRMVQLPYRLDNTNEVLNAMSMSNRDWLQLERPRIELNTVVGNT